MSASVKGHRNALFLFFFIVGVSMASWITRSPDIRDRLAVSIAEMGMVLSGLSVGSMSGILLAGLLVRRTGTKAGTFAGLLFVAAGLLTMAVGLALQLAWMVAIGLGLIGAGMGLSEIAINIDGAYIESRLGRPVLHSLHGFFSLGVTFGAAAGMVLTSLAFPVQWHLAIVAVLCLPAITWAIRHVPGGRGIRSGSQHQGLAADARPGWQAWREPRLLMIGFIVLAMAFAEGSANDWLPLLMVDEHGFAASSGSAVFMVFAFAMTVARFGGGFFLKRFGRVAVMRASALSGVLGLAMVILTHSPVMAGIAVVLWGLGAALGFPLALSAAGDSGPDPDTRVRIAATAGYIAFLVGPPLLGFVGEAFGLRNALYIVLVPVLIAAVIASAVAMPAMPHGAAVAGGEDAKSSKS